MPLPNIDEVYVTYFDRWYDDGDRQRKVFAHARPDIAQQYRPGMNVRELCRLTSECSKEVQQRVYRMIDSAKVDWPAFLPLVEPVDESWVHTFDSYFSSKTVADLLLRSDPEDFSNDLVVSVCQFGVIIGVVLQSMLPRLQWLWEWPYWESSLYDGESGSVIPPFHWAMKKFSDYGIDDGFAEKLHACVHVLNEHRKTDGPQ